MQINNRMRDYLTLIRMAIIKTNKKQTHTHAKQKKKTIKQKITSEDVEKLEHLLFQPVDGM